MPLKAPAAPNGDGALSVVADHIAATKAVDHHPRTVDEFLTEAEIVTRYRGAITPGTLKNWRHQKSGPPWVRVGRVALYPRSELLIWEHRQRFPKP